MIDAPFRAILPSVVGPVLKLYARLGLTPNQVTVGGALLALVAAGFTMLDMTWTAIAFWWLGRLMDGTDGIYARATGKVSDFGAYIDILLDMASYGVMPIAFAIAQPENAFLWQLVLFLYVLCITSALALGSLHEKRRLAAQDNRSLRLAAGLAEGGETGIAYTLFLAFPGSARPLIYLWIVVLMVTVVARTMLAWRTLAAEEAL
jgi:phosphatidylglycerophosphate synthase